MPLNKETKPTIKCSLFKFKDAALTPQMNEYNVGVFERFFPLYNADNLKVMFSRHANTLVLSYRLHL